MTLPAANEKNQQPQSIAPVIILAGATGNLGHRIAYYLLQSGAHVRALVRKGSNSPLLDTLRHKGAAVIEVDFRDVADLTLACAGGTCIVSALSGVEDIIIDVQIYLLQAAIAASVPRFIPSDYCIDYTKLATGTNRNLDLRRTFNEKLDAAPIQATSILNGMFTDLLTGQAPVVLFKWKKVVYWGNPDIPLDFTTADNTAAYTAAAALDRNTPRYLRIAGAVTTINGLKETASIVTGKPFSLLRAGSLSVLKTMISFTRTLMPKKEEVFPPWQGMQYLHNMFTGLPKLNPLDNNRYKDIQWTSVGEVLAGRSV